MTAVLSRCRSGRPWAEADARARVKKIGFPSSARLQPRGDWATLTGCDLTRFGTCSTSVARLSIRRAWRDAFTRLSAADGEAPLEPEDLERLATAAYLIGQDYDAHAAWSRAYHEHVDRGDAARAARCGYWLSLTLLLADEGAQASGWLARSHRLLDDRGLDCAEQGYLLVIRAYQTLSGGDAMSAGDISRDAHAIGVRFADPELTALGLLGEGEALIEHGDSIEGSRLLDEAMIAVTGGEVSPISVGILYCASILAVQRAFDLRRVYEWTQALDRWSGSKADLVPFRGQCLVHRAEIKALHGAWPEALVEVQRACDWLTDPRQPAAGIAFYQRGELLRLRGDLEGAEDAYREASSFGFDPNPGLALLRLAQGRIDLAAAAVGRVLDEARARGRSASATRPHPRPGCRRRDPAGRRRHRWCSRRSGDARGSGRPGRRAVPPRHVGADVGRGRDRGRFRSRGPGTSSSRAASLDRHGRAVRGRARPGPDRAGARRTRRPGWRGARGRRRGDDIQAARGGAGSRAHRTDGLGAPSRTTAR